MTIYLGTDHAGYDLKEAVKHHLTEKQISVVDLGAFSIDNSDSFVDYVVPVARKVVDEADARGIIFGGSGQGEAMAVNRTKGIRAAVFYGPMQPLTAINAQGDAAIDEYEIVRLSRLHNDSNVLSIGARFVSVDQALHAVDIWLATNTSDDPKYGQRNRQLDGEGLSL